MEKQNEAIHNNERRDEEGGERERERDVVQLHNMMNGRGVC